MRFLNDQTPQPAGSGTTPASQTVSPGVPLPPDGMIILPARNIVLFPGMVAPLTIGRPTSIAAVQQAMR